MAKRSRRTTGFTLIEILVSVLILSLSVAAMATLWSLSRNITERSRDTAEYATIGRQEIERDKAIGFTTLFSSGASAPAIRYTDYDQNGLPLATNYQYQTPPYPTTATMTVNGGLTLTSTATTSPRLAYYRSVVTYSLVPTGSETGDKRLGVAVVQVYKDNGTTTFDTSTVVYQTVAFYTKPGV